MNLHEKKISTKVERTSLVLMGKVFFEVNLHESGKNNTSNLRLPYGNGQSPRKWKELCKELKTIKPCFMKKDSINNFSCQAVFRYQTSKMLTDLIVMSLILL